MLMIKQINTSDLGPIDFGQMGPQLLEEEGEGVPTIPLFPYSFDN